MASRRTVSEKCVWEVPHTLRLFSSSCLSEEQSSKATDPVTKLERRNKCTIWMTLLEGSNLFVHDKMPSVTDLRLHTHQSDLSQIPQTLTNCEFLVWNICTGTHRKDNRRPSDVYCPWKFDSKQTRLTSHSLQLDLHTSRWNTELFKVYFIRFDQQGATPEVF